jgi:hypothetical protein
MIYPWWGRREDLDGEIQSLMGTSELTVWMDSVHNCLHVMRGDEEFTSVMYPLDDRLRDELRQQAYILHNGEVESEIQRIKEANEKREAYGENVMEEAKRDWRDEATYRVNKDLFGQGPISVISPGVPHDS